MEFSGDFKAATRFINRSGSIRLEFDGLSLSSTATLVSVNAKPQLAFVGTPKVDYRAIHIYPSGLNWLENFVLDILHLTLRC
jgi:hypothetical protein